MVLTKVVLMTRDLETTISFYHHLLGMPMVHQSTSSVSFVVGYSLLTFQLQQDEQAPYHFAFLVPANKIEEAYDWVKKRTPILPFSNTTDMADFANWNAHAFYFHDPHKNIVEFIAHHALKNDTAATFTIEALVGICEIGMPVADVTVACATLHQQHHIPYFVKGPRQPDFAVMGDDEGLLIVTKMGRGWLPTGQPATSFPQCVELKQDDFLLQLKAGDLK